MILNLARFTHIFIITHIKILRSRSRYDFTALWRLTTALKNFHESEKLSPSREVLIKYALLLQPASRKNPSFTFESLTNLFVLIATACSGVGKTWRMSTTNFFETCENPQRLEKLVPEIRNFPPCFPFILFIF